MAKADQSGATMMTSTTVEEARLIEEARGIEFYQGDLTRLANLLPKDDEELVALLERRMEALQGRVFSHLWMAAHWAGRRVPARLLAKGAELMSEMTWILATAGLCVEREEGPAGEICECLLEAVATGHQDEYRGVVCLICAARSWRDAYGEEEPYPEQLGFLSRQVVRKLHTTDPNGKSAAQLLISILACLTGDEVLIRTLNERFFGYRETVARESMEDFFLKFGDLKNYGPEQRPERVLSGYQVRRAVAKVGRNEPCPCGSGKRYKKCCLRKDQQKLSRSSSVPGKTLDDLEKEKEERLTMQSLADMQRHEVMRLDPKRIKVDMIKLVIQRLVEYHEYDHVMTIYEQSPYPDWEGWEDAFLWVFVRSCRDKRYELALQVAEMFPGIEEKGAIDLEFIRARGDHSAILRLLEKHCEAILKAEDDDEKGPLAGASQDEDGREQEGETGARWVELAFCLMACDLPFLEIAFARGILPLAPRDEVDLLLEAIEERREMAGLSRFDVSEDLTHFGDTLARKAMLEMAAAKISTLYTDQLATTSTDLERRTQDLAELKRSLQESSARAEEAEAIAQEKEAALASLKAEESAGAEDRIAENEREIAELRDRLRMLKSEVKRKHDQRNELRRELRDVRREAMAKSETSSRDKVAEAARADEEEEALLAAPTGEDGAITSGIHMPRIPIFPPDFLEKVKPFPAHVQSAVFQLVGRLASGDPSAFVGVRMLKMSQNLLRQRFSDSYRLIFRLKGDQLEIVAAINRRDLDRWLQRELR